MQKEKPKPSSEDLSFWSELTKDITKTEQPLLIEKAPPVLPEIRNTINPQHVYSGNSLNALDIGAAPDIDRRTAERFCRGEFKIERRLDLHGYTEDRAYEAVENFVKNAYLQGLRCILIVTGKGRPHPDDDPFVISGILKEKVPQWLNNPILRPLILSISYSRPQDGGDGALYILLRRKRS